MNKDQDSCIVSSYTKCNSATKHTQDETIDETQEQLLDLQSLSFCVLKRNQCNQTSNSTATSKLHSIKTPTTAIVSNNLWEEIRSSCTVAGCKGGNHATHKIHCLIEQISKNHGGDEPNFLKSYIETVLEEWSHDLDKALICFNDLAKQNA